MSRPSIHNPITKSYAIDQIEDIDHLRAVAHRMWEAFFASHSQTAHVFGAFVRDECAACRDGEEPCQRWQEWQAKVDAGFGSV